MEVSRTICKVKMEPTGSAAAGRPVPRPHVFRRGLLSRGGTTDEHHFLPSGEPTESNEWGGCWVLRAWQGCRGWCGEEPERGAP